MNGTRALMTNHREVFRKRVGPTEQRERASGKGGAVPLRPGLPGDGLLPCPGVRSAWRPAAVIPEADGAKRRDAGRRAAIAVQVP